MQPNLHEEAQQVLDNMKWIVVDVDEEKRLLEGVVSRFAVSGEGTACVVVGEPCSGRTTTVKGAVEEFQLDAKLQVISVAQLGSDRNALQLLTTGEDMKRCVLVVEDADELATRQRQSLLYLLLDMTRKNSDHQWLNFMTSLEKRVRSRLSTARILFHPALKIEDYVAAFETFLGKATEQCSKEWEAFVTAFISDPSVRAELEYVYSANASYTLLKQLTSAFLCLYLDNIEGVPPAELFAEAVEMVMPTLSMWSLCVLLCVYRRLRSCPQSATVGYRKILQDFRRVGNTVDSRVRVPSDLAVYKELDRLVELGLLEADTKANNMVFRRCSLNMNTQNLGKILREITLPAAIEYWFETQAAE
ncbi:hypothetical protein ANCDUO_20619 [Ancylostoma duodenale]|uniref:ATPase AAA-type core domain-containing protein n=1 Tax=Ancylostoma duodenale TaxID=51022 RepID=A0A0C2FWM5_9BILA|nr:hypothetical protein ANCDUO_20619 [Ancylostoma duodenale]